MDGTSARPVTDGERRRVASLARLHFGHGDLKPGQADALVRTLRGENVLAVLPTGGGKSLVYQLPALLGQGITVVVSPLIALMKDQLEGLPDVLRADTVAVSSQLPPGGLDRALRDIRDGRVKLVFAAPERFRSPRFLHALREGGKARGDPGRLVVDEAHCVSLWGHNFRPDYLLIPEARAALGNPPVLALTATAPRRVREDVARRLGTDVTVDAPVVRDNLRLESVEAKDADDKLAHLATLVREATRPVGAAPAETPCGIVYASSQAKCESIASALRAQGIAADHYHAGAPDRDARQDAFMRGDTRVLVATVAFGMGIDKADVRFILHHDPSDSLESYYQEAGRAGRDGKPARCVVIVTKRDLSQLKRRGRSDVPKADAVQAVLDRITVFVEPPGPEHPSGTGWAIVAPEAIDDAAGGDIAGRVALGVLVESGAVERHMDVPVLITLLKAGGDLADVDGIPQTVLDLAPRLGVAPHEVDARLHELEETEGVIVRRSERRHLLRVTGDTSRIARTLKGYGRLAEERADEMMTYATGKGCLHAHLAHHFQQDAPPTCGNCDRCLRIRHVHDPDLVPDDETTAKRVLLALVNVRGMGETNLIRVLRADPDAPDWAAGNPAWGRLALRSASVIKNIMQALTRRGLVERQTLDHGGESLRATEAGVTAYHDGATLLALPESSGAAATNAPGRTGPPGTQAAAGVSRANTTPAAPPAGAPQPTGGPLFQALREWRGGLAREARVPPYVIASDAVLKAIEEAMPRTMQELLAVKGIGPAKAEMFGADILAMVEEMA